MPNASCAGRDLTSPSLRRRGKGEVPSVVPASGGCRADSFSASICSRIMVCRRLLVVWIAPLLTSQPIHRRPSCCATAAVVPLPIDALFQGFVKIHGIALGRDEAPLISASVRSRHLSRGRGTDPGLKSCLSPKDVSGSRRQGSAVESRS
jgi:hypothetical protein